METKAIKPQEHSRLSASYLAMVMECQKSLPTDLSKVEEESSPQIDYGNATHELFAYELNKNVGISCEEPNSPFIDDEKKLIANVAASYVLKDYKRIKKIDPNAKLLVEQRLDLTSLLSDGSEECWGYCDAVILSKHSIFVYDVKTGVNLVDASDKSLVGKFYKFGNHQLSAYAYGVYELVKNDPNYDIKSIKLVILQNRFNNIQTHRLSLKRLLKWKDYIHPLAVAALKGEGVYHPNEYCKWCKNNKTCRAYIVTHTAWMDILKKPEELSTEEIDYLLGKIPDFKKACDALWNYALTKALEEKFEWKSVALVDGKTTREFIDEEVVKKITSENGITNIYKTTMLSVAQLEKLLGKPRFKELLSSCVTYKTGKPTLAVRDEKTAHMSNAKNEFIKEN